MPMDSSIRFLQRSREGGQKERIHASKPQPFAQYWILQHGSRTAFVVLQHWIGTPVDTVRSQGSTSTGIPRLYKMW